METDGAAPMQTSYQPTTSHEPITVNVVVEETLRPELIETRAELAAAREAARVASDAQVGELLAARLVTASVMADAHRAELVARRRLVSDRFGEGGCSSRNTFRSGDGGSSDKAGGGAAAGSGCDLGGGRGAGGGSRGSGGRGTPSGRRARTRVAGRSLQGGAASCGTAQQGRVGGGSAA